MKQRFVLGISVALLLLVPAQGSAQNAGDDLRTQILTDCELKAWQFSVRIEQGGGVFPQMSPTLPDWQKKCIQKEIKDYIDGQDK